ncbi:uncharacterized protein MELLADRAFT_95650 [Melampsora larici-populina 98AG31]|uniref:Uncharacterized protein n=1 Tax=Melampsora larici-populina (strain 98AG31 / pathotype 3-4-7) TaxID=747676 RepID=F4SA34_MELLP|nr:uncharacterized protein MELLADRAFT_95650 [Melampsora larici-populina 98AG31]EGF98479.1 hypothetical protein MELLADRAFT_95650 [Melampsora larici-populina 98AG31]
MTFCKFKAHGFYDRATHVRNRSWSSTSISYYQSRHRILDEYGIEHDPEHCQFRTVSPVRHHHHQHDQDQEDLENSSSDSDSDSDEDERSLSSSTTPGFPSARLTHHDFCCSRHRERSGSTASSSKLSSSDRFSFLPPPPTTSYPRPMNLNLHHPSSRKHSLPLRLPDRNRAGSQSSSKLSFESTPRLSSLPIREKILSIHSSKDERLSSSLGFQASSNLKHFTTLERPSSSTSSNINLNLSHHKSLKPTVLVIDDPTPVGLLHPSLELDLDLNEGLENMPLTSMWLKNPLVFETLDHHRASNSSHLNPANLVLNPKRFQKSLVKFKLDCRITLLRTRQRLSKVLKKS